MIPLDRLLIHAQVVLLGLGVLYLVLVTSLTIPFFQRHALYLHALGFPLSPDFETPAKYGLPVHRSLNVQVQTADNLKLGAWLILSEADPGSFATDETYPLSLEGPPSPAFVNASLSTRPTILFFHGNAATRAMPFRVQFCKTYARAFGANVLAIDYRGFGDSEGNPSEEGLIRDARAAWDWVRERGARPEDVLLVGLSLGTGVVSGLAHQLTQEGISPRGVVLQAPFTSIGVLLQTYHLFGVIPILQPLGSLPVFTNFLLKYLQTRFDTQSIISNISAPIFIVHSHDDADIPIVHSQTLFDTLLEPMLPALPPLPYSPTEIKQFDWPAFERLRDDRLARKSAIVSVQEVPAFGSMHTFHRSGATGELYPVVFVETKWGGHNRIGVQDTVIDITGKAFFSKPVVDSA